MNARGAKRIAMLKTRIEKFSIFSYILVILLSYPLLNILYKDKPVVQNLNRVVLVLVTVLIVMIFLKNIFKTKLKKTDVLIVIVSIYIGISLTFYFFNSKLAFSDFLKEALYSIVPYLVYFIFISAGEKYKDITINILIYIMVMSSIIGIILYFNLRMPLFNSIFVKLKEENTFFWQLSSIYGVIIMGYLSQLMYALILFDKYKGKYKKLLLVFFIVITILTLQRSAFIGVIISTCAYMALLVKQRNIARIFNKVLPLILLITIGVFLFITIIDRRNILNYNLLTMITSKFQQIRLDMVIADRESQAIIFNDSNIIKILFGEGFGKYSPNNSVAILIQADASYYRIYNELGLVGFILFFSPFIYILFKAIPKKDYFMIYFITFTLIAFYFNRIIWAIPSNFIIFIILGFFGSDRHRLHAL